MKPRKIVIIGSGIAGLSAGKSARTQDSFAEITIISRDTHPPYYRLRLCEMIGTDTAYENFYINPISWYKKNKFTLLLSTKVLSINCETKKITTDKGDIDFDSLIIASGSTPAMPPFAGKDLPGIHTLWNFEDITAINEGLKKSQSAVVIGGGLLGLETAYRISQMGITTTLIEGMSRLLPKQLDEEGSVVFTKKVGNLGIHVITGQSVTEFKGDGHVQEVVLADATVIKTDIVIVSVGVKPNTSICEDSGILLDRYIPVTEKMQVKIISHNTSDEIETSDISNFLYAAGDVASFNKEWFGQWPVALLQGQTAGTNAAGGNALYHMENSPYILNTMGTRVVVSGDVIDSMETDTYVIKETIEETYSYIKLVFKNGFLTGGVLIGDYSSKFVKLQSLIKGKAPKDTVSITDFISDRIFPS